MENGENKNVFRVYDRIANWFSKHRDVELFEKNYLDSLKHYLPNGGSVLDLGCGTGKPILNYLLSKNLNFT
jgi:ubiquinone/menaquinone biosynthesis C-methylase UbiE